MSTGLKPQRWHDHFARRRAVRRASDQTWLRTNSRAWASEQYAVRRAVRGARHVARRQTGSVMSTQVTNVRQATASSLIEASLPLPARASLLGNTLQARFRLS